MTSLGLLLSGGAAPADGQDLGAYGVDMCAEVGIPADQCTLSGPGSAEAVSSDAAFGDKTATLAEHGRRVCAKEGVPLEDCRALPVSLRGADETVPPAAPFLTVPATIPVLDPGLAPAPVIADAPIPTGQRAVRYARPQRRPVEPPLPYAVPAPVGVDLRYSDPPRFVEPGVRYAEPALPPIEPRARAFRQRQPVERIFRYVEPPAPVVERPERVGRLERFREVAPSGRCLRAVRYSRPPSYRYVTC